MSGARCHRDFIIETRRRFKEAEIGSCVEADCHDTPPVTGRRLSADEMGLHRPTMEVRAG
jgi:hypothetical protein